jgi:RNA polymerase sigma-70 factor (ECF subfamily)
MATPSGSDVRRPFRTAPDRQHLLQKVGHGLRVHDNVISMNFRAAGDADDVAIGADEREHDERAAATVHSIRTEATERDEARQRDAAELVGLIEASAQGDDAAFAALYDRTKARIYGLVVRVLRSPDHAAEVTQEVYVEIWRQSARFDKTKGSVLAWMTTMAHRRAIDRIRSVTSEVARDERYAVKEGGREVDEVWERVEQGFENERVREGLAALTAIQREALTLAYFGGLTQSQVANQLKIPLGTVKTRMRDGLIALRGALGVEA